MKDIGYDNQLKTFFFILAGRRIINPMCGANFNGGSSGSRHFNDNVEPGYVNFYSIHPNYFFYTDDNRRIRINRSGGGTGTLIVCHSRVVEHPRYSFNSLHVRVRNTFSRYRHTHTLHFYQPPCTSKEFSAQTSKPFCLP